MWAFYLKLAYRSINRKRLFSILNVVGIAVGISVFLLSLEFYSYEKGFNAFHTNLSGLYRVGLDINKGKSLSTYPTLAPIIKQHIPGVKSAIRFAPNFNDGAIITYQPDSAGATVRSFREDGVVFVDSGFLSAFNFPLVAGAKELTDPNSVIITKSAATRVFGHEEALGKTIQLHNQFGILSLKITGVTRDIPDQSDILFSYLVSIHVLDNPSYTEGSDWAKLNTWNNDSYITYLWLNEGTDPKSVANSASLLWRNNDKDYGKKRGSIFLQPVSDIHLGQSWNDDSPTYASYALTTTVLGLGILLLCIAWINYINFATADALTRAKEVGIHMIVGSARKQIAWRAVTESLLLNSTGVALAMFLIGLLQDLFNYMTQRPLKLDYLNTPSNWIVAVLVVTAGSLACGAYTGLLLARLKPITALHLNDPGKMGHSLIRKGLVVFQLTVSCLFIGVTMVAFRQISFMKKENLGMSIDHLVAINGPALKDSSFKTNSVTFRTEVSRLSFVEKFSSSGSVPGIGSGHNFESDGITGAIPHQGDDRIGYSISLIDEKFFSAYHIPILYGSDFTAADADKGFKGDQVIVNETAARALGYDPNKAVNNIVKWDKIWHIAGVVKDYHHRSLKDPIEPILFIAQHNNSVYTIQTSSENLASKMQSVEAIYARLYPGNSFTWQPLRQTFDSLYANDQRTGVIALTLAILIIVISGLGLIGLAAFTARRRTKEMGIRKVLGASTTSLFLQLANEYIWLVVLSFVIATPVAWLVTENWLKGFAFRIQPGWLTFAIAGLICLSFTMITVAYHALRTAFVDPVKQLRTD